MAERLGKFPEHGNAHRHYPWNEWLDGSAWKLIAGVDFTGDARTFRQTAYAAAKRRGFKVRIHPDGPNIIYIQKREP